MARTMTITRFAWLPESTLGYLECGDFNCYTVEKPWLNNQPNISCIPTGIYVCHPTEFYGSRDVPLDTWEVMNVEGRTEIKIHYANRGRDLQGCIGLGISLGVIQKEYAVIDSSGAHLLFMAHVKSSKRIDLEIRNHNPDGLVSW